MIKKHEFYHGVALISLLDDKRCQSVNKFESGYLVNNQILFFLKYTTKKRSPWQFIFNLDEIEKLSQCSAMCEKMYLAFVCGGDGICVVDWKESKNFFDEKTRWISVKRGFNKWFSVKGSKGEFKSKVPLRGWPATLFV
jgi:hypothetical protein